jgi:N-dimethylarginine dimethylaminohydrolase
MKATQEGREDWWISRIRQTVKEETLLIAIVGKDHITPGCEHYNRPSIGHFAKKLEKEGFEVRIIDITQILERLEKELL